MTLTTRLMAVVATSIASISMLTAQMTKVGYADPNQYTHRLHQFIDNRKNYEAVYDYNEAGYLIKIQYFNSSSEPTNHTNFTYNEQGQLVEMLVFDRQSTATGEFIASKKVIYQYDADGYITDYERATLWKNISQDDDELTPDWRVKLEYDNNHRPVKGYITFINTETEVFGDPNVIWTPTYDDQGRMIKTEKKTPQGAMIQSRTISYNEQGKVDGYSLTTAEKNDTTSWMIIYDAQGNPIKIGRTGFMFEYEFDETLSIDKVFMPTDQTIIQLVLFGYENWMFHGKIPYTHSANNPIKMAVTRNIEYYYEENTKDNAVERINEQPSMKVAVANGVITVSTDSDLKGRHLALFTIEGQCVHSQLIKQNESVINVNQLPHGLYIVKAGQQSVKVIL